MHKKHGNSNSTKSCITLVKMMYSIAVLTILLSHWLMVTMVLSCVMDRLVLERLSQCSDLLLTTSTEDLFLEPLIKFSLKLVAVSTIRLLLRSLSEVGGRFDNQITVKISLVEIYNELLFDMLSTTPTHEQTGTDITI